MREKTAEEFIINQWYESQEENAKFQEKISALESEVKELRAIKEQCKKVLVEDFKFRLERAASDIGMVFRASDTYEQYDTKEFKAIYKLCLCLGIIEEKDEVTPEVNLVEE